MGSTLKQILKDENLNLSSNPLGTDKGDYKSYIDKFYETNFISKKTKPIRLLEIGFRHGASLALWSTYFTNGTIIGLDNSSDPAVQEGAKPFVDWIKKRNVITILGDAYLTSFANTIADKFDIIIDDGPHTLSSQQIALELYLPKLNLDGYFVIEDIQRFGGLTIFPLLSKVPLGFKVRFYDFRFHKNQNDNILFVVENDGKSNFINRIEIIFIGIFYVFAEPCYQMARKLVKIFR